MKRIVCIVAFAATLCGQVAGPGKRTTKALGPRAVNSTTIGEVLAKNVTLAPGASQKFFAQSDFTGTESVKIAFYAAADQDLSSTNYLVWWSVPDADNYAVSDYLQGKYFAFLNTGGAFVQTYGNQLLIEMRNDGKNPVTISQITLYAVAR